jgi:hypothetical protein
MTPGSDDADQDGIVGWKRGEQGGKEEDRERKGQIQCTAIYRRLPKKKKKKKDENEKGQPFTIKFCNVVRYLSTKNDY